MSAPPPVAATASYPQLGPRLTALAAAVGGPLLACDTSGEVASLALVTPPAAGTVGADNLTEVSLAARALPSEAVMQALVDLLQAAHVAPTDLRALVVGLGPGSFTGLRVGMATLKGLAYGAKVPMYGSSSLAMLAASCGPGPVAVVRDARRDHVYVGAYEVGADGEVECLLADARLMVGEAQAAIERAVQQREAAASRAEIRWCGEGVSLLNRAVNTASSVLAPRAGLMLLHADARLRRGIASNLTALVPAYLFDFVPA